MAPFKETHTAKSKGSLLSVAVMMLSLCWVSTICALEDPTRPPTATSSSIHVNNKSERGPRWTLHSTLVSSDRRTAVINNRVVSLGDRINGATVVSIQPSEVRLRDKNREVTLMMLKKNIKSLSQATSSGQGK